MPTCLHFPSQNPPKSLQESISKGIDFSIDFSIDLFSILARFWRPTWCHVGHIFFQNGVTLWDAAPFFVGSMLFFDFLAVLAPSWRHLGSILEGFGLDFEGFSKGFWLEIDGFPTGFGLDFEGFPRRFGGIVFLVLDGLVGLREAQRIATKVVAQLEMIFDYKLATQLIQTLN